MPGSMAQARRRRGIAVALLLSLAGHGLLVLPLVLVPGRPAPAVPFFDTTVAAVRLSISPVRRASPGRLKVQDLPDDAEVTVTELPPVNPPRSQALAAAAGGTVARPGPHKPGGAGTAPVADATAGRPSAGQGLLAVPAAARSVVFLVDHSLSMEPSGALDAALAEVVASLRRLPATTWFQVIPYNRAAEPLPLDRRGGLVVADAATVERAARLLDEVRAGGGTDHAHALRRGLLLRPEVLYLVTDGNGLSLEEMHAITRLNAGRTVIHVVELNGARAWRLDSLLCRLATENGGTYRRVAPGR
jgi:hypothetical protein